MALEQGVCVEREQDFSPLASSNLQSLGSAKQKGMHMNGLFTSWSTLPGDSSVFCIFFHVKFMISL